MSNIAQLASSHPVFLAAILPFVERDMQSARRRGHIQIAEEDKRLLDEIRAQLSEVTQ